MTLHFGFYNSVTGDRLYDAIDMSRIFDGIILDGVYAAFGDSLMVVENTGMNVAVGTGRAWFDHTWSYNDAEVVIAVPTADALLPRIDVVYIEINEDSGVRANEFNILEGTPATEPVAPTLTNTSTVHQYPLAHIEVAATVTAITQANIVNKVGTTECPFVTCPLEYVTTNELLAQWEAEWEEWFDAIKDQLSSEAETNLQAQIWAIVGDINPPLMTLIDLDTHDHTDYGDQIPTGGLVNLAITTAKLDNLAVTEGKLAALAATEAKLGNLAVTAGKLGPLSVVASKLGDDIAGNGLGGGDGSALLVNVDGETLEISGDYLRVKAEGITPDQIDNRYRTIFIPANDFYPVTGAAKVYDAEEGIRLEFLNATNIAVCNFRVPMDVLSNIDMYLVVQVPAGGTPATYWEFELTELHDGRLITDPVDDSFYAAITNSNADMVYHKPFNTYYTPGELGCPVSLLTTRIGGHVQDLSTASAFLYGILLSFLADS